MKIFRSNNPNKQSETSDVITSEIKDMEAHHHPHHVTHKRKWTEYLLESIMLFLAVFFGFVTENAVNLIKLIET